MRASHPCSIETLFTAFAETGCKSLAQLQQRATMLLKLNRTVSTLLPPPLRCWCRVANVRQGVLVLETVNASWKMRLHYEQTKLLAALRVQILPSLSAIDIRINPNLVRRKDLNMPNNDNSRRNLLARDEKILRLSIKSAISIRHVAGRSEGKLKNILERLAGLAGKSACLLLVAVN